MNKIDTKRKSILPEGYVFGRPTLYKPEYCQQLIDHMAQGLSFKSFAARVPCTESTIAEWALEHKDFSDAKAKGKALERMVWEQLHVKCSATGKGNMTGIVWAQKNKWPAEYRDRSETVIAHDINLKSLISNMDANQLCEVIAAISAQTALLEEKHGKEENNKHNE